ncbi:DUF2868 domain-containing protein [Sulfurovum sp. bin170]|uniref:DUF2868 domain-containing protein n=1 Tax=Sulfurovum sp. bin170 TaxID=2695268 RepID=UPI0013DF16CA|nr:DUF2868 domain-containing protein [Sulfurovum sp. bin170]NEW60991.1 DUF2868 domain-containing protein [Sulfurovum sp. bin170]
MQTKNSNLSIKTYLDFSQLLELYRGDHEQNRSFALKREKLLQNPLKLLLDWSNLNQFRLTEELNSKSYLSYLSRLSSIFGLLFFIIGFFVGLGLLSYSGEAPVNIIYYLLIVMVVPLLSMTLSLLSMLTHGGVADFFNHLFPLHWIEKLFSTLPFAKRVDSLDSPLSAELSKWIFIERIQLLSLLFSFGLLISLLLMVVVKDIAFGWSTTLQLSPEVFQSILASIGILWEGVLPSAIPSLELVEISQHFRLGRRVDPQMIQNADKLGAWWKFLAMTTIVYAICFRFILWLISKYGVKRQLERDFLALEGVQGILREFNTSFISTKAPKQEIHLEIVEDSIEQVSDNMYKSYNTIFGWNFLKDEIVLANDAKEIRGLAIFAVGGSSSFSEDESKAENAKESVLLFVKSWEPPTMDFIDFLEILIENREVHEVQLYPLGTVGRYYDSDAKDIAIWRRKIQGLKSKKVWVIDDAE